MSGIALETKENLQLDSFTTILDKGYHNGREIETCQKAGIVTLVCPPTIVNSNEKGTTPAYVVSKFTYNTESDTYICPAGSTLRTIGTWHKKTRERDSYPCKKYRTPDCKTCPVQALCTAKADGRREIERSQYAEAVAQNGFNYINNKDLYRKRQEINEHVFGSIKRQWGYNPTNLRGLEKVNGEMALIMTIYNMKRAINILGIEKLLEKLKSWKPDYPKANFSLPLERFLGQFNESYLLGLCTSSLKCETHGDFWVKSLQNAVFSQPDGLQLQDLGISETKRICPH